ncbi:MAG: class I SAM-dependent methyltransferase [Flavobacteriaceae bacterium]
MNLSRKNKTPWPTKDAMTQVYDMNLWGGDAHEFYSGEGSHLTKFVAPYITVVQSFLQSFSNPLTVCDLGCGDFNIGKELVKYSKNYIAVDIVENLIIRNQTRFKDENLEFKCIDIAKDQWPKGNCVILRQVLQHLSNNEIASIVSKLTEYKYVILTEHLPQDDFIANTDIISGQGIRLKNNSGVNILAEPFNVKVNDVQELLAIPLDNNKGIIKTYLYTCF